ncbi:MAG: hypothetical protein CFE45_08910 [Burkholderiales bacterium PBB5]|nr:MAG: hypothetical protein CFE45_08910 [Burkholderiales bacterium PBB5]
MLLAAVLPGLAAAQGSDWRLRRFDAVATVTDALAKQYFPNQTERAYTYVNWRHLDGDTAIDALVIVKNSKASCSLPSTRCVAAVLTTGHAGPAGGLGVLGTYFPTSEPTFLRQTPEGVRLWIPENRSNFVEVLLPRQAGQGWQVVPEKRTRRMATGDGSSLVLEEDDFVLLDLQRAAIARLGPGDAPPAGAPFTYVGEANAPERDAGARAVQSALDRLAAGRTLDSAPTIDFARCLSGGFSRSTLAEFMARSLPSDDKTRAIVVCVDEIPPGMPAESRRIVQQLWDTRLWTASVQAASSYAHQPLRLAAERSGLPKQLLANVRALADLGRFARLDAATALRQLNGLGDLSDRVPESVASETQRFVSQVYRPALFALACGLRDLTTLDRDTQQQLSKLRRDNQAACDLAVQTVNALP